MATNVSPGLCGNCEHTQVMRSDRGSIFYRCKLSDTDPRFPKYPRLPVLECDGWKPVRLQEESPAPQSNSSGPVE